MKRQLRLEHLLRKHFHRLGDSFLALEKAITEAHMRAEGIDPRTKITAPVGRRKLRRILERGTSTDVSFRISELEAIDDFLNEHHEGLAFVPLFERPTLLPALVAQKHVNFLVGAREIHGNLSVSHFDMKAYADAGRDLNRAGLGVTWELDVVLQRSTREDAISLRDEHWQSIVANARAVVAIASPLSNHATDLLLARMFGCQAFQAPSSQRPRPELAMVLTEPTLSETFSSFVEPPAKNVSQIRDRRWALRVGNDLFVAEDEEKVRSKTYGVIVAQRRANGSVWIVAAGLHGAGTHAAALALPDAEISLVSGRPGENGPVHVSVVEALVSCTKSARGALIRKVDDHRILTEYDRAFAPRSEDPGLRKAEPF